MHLGHCHLDGGAESKRWSQPESCLVPSRTFSQGRLRSTAAHRSKALRCRLRKKRPQPSLDKGGLCNARVCLSNFSQKSNVHVDGDANGMHAYSTSMHTAESNTESCREGPLRELRISRAKPTHPRSHLSRFRERAGVRASYQMFVTNEPAKLSSPWWSGHTKSVVATFDLRSSSASNRQASRTTALCIEILKHTEVDPKIRTSS
jgi:hypothetical protein